MSVFPEQQAIEKRGRGRPRKTDPDYKPHPGGRKFQKHPMKSEMEDRHYCPSCLKSHKHYSSVKLHQKIHTKIFMNPLILKSYKQLKVADQCYVSQSFIEPGQKVVTCKTCNGEFRFFSLWLRHYRLKHARYMRCTRCNGKYHMAMELRRHRAMKHRGRVVTKPKVLKKFKIHQQRLEKSERSQPVEREKPKKYKKKHKGKKGTLSLIEHYRSEHLFCTCAVN